jgi:hypothetical protein
VEVLIFIAVFVVIIGFSFWMKHRQRANWQTVAHELGLQFIEGGLFTNPSMQGTYRGADLSVRIVTSGTGKNKRVYTVVEVPLSGLVPVDLEVYREGFFQKVGKVIGGEDIQVGDADLDDTFIIKGTERDKVRDLLTSPNVKSRLLSAQSKCSTFRIGVGNVRIRERGRTANPNKLRGYIRTVVATANALEEACQGKPNRTPRPQSPHATNQAGHPANQPAPAPPPPQPAPQPAEPGLSTVPFGRPAASGAPADEQTSPSNAPQQEPDTATTGEDDWW